MRFLLLFICILSYSTGYSQIDNEEKSMQAIGYWKMAESHTYIVHHAKHTISNGDTLSSEIIKKDVKITVTDSTDVSYTLEWEFSGGTSTVPKHEKLVAAEDGLVVVVKTDEMGRFMEVVNWEEIKSKMSSKIGLVRGRGADFMAYKKSMLAKYSSEGSIVNNALSDIKQYYAFFGNKYTLNKAILGQSKFTNSFGGEPFDVEYSIVLDEIDEEDGSSVVRLYEQVNTDQLTNATYDFIVKNNKNGDELPPKSEMIFTNEIWTASRIHSYSGWILASLETKKLSANGYFTIDETMIELVN